MLDFLRELKSYLDPETILRIAGDLSLPVLFLIIFAETGLMIGFFLPGDSLLFIAGLFCAAGIIPVSIYTLIGSLIVAAVVGDQVGYWIGKKLGKRLFTKEESLLFKPKYVEQTRAFYDRHGAKTIIIGRFVPIVRTFAPVLAGVTQISYTKFIIYNITGGVIWITSMSLLGYLPFIILGQERAEVMIKPFIPYITLVIILISVIPIVTTYFQERRTARRRKAEADNTPPTA